MAGEPGATTGATRVPAINIASGAQAFARLYSDRSRAVVVVNLTNGVTGADPLTTAAVAKLLRY